MGNRRIREVTARGIISTVAGNGIEGCSCDGGLATNAELGAPWGLAVDASGNIDIADSLCNRVRKVTASTGIISTVAGTGKRGFNGDGQPAVSAELSAPRGITVDSAGNLYFCDAGNERVRKVDASTGLISTVAGNGQAGESGDGGPATSAKLTFPSALALDVAGDLFIGDTTRVRMVTSSSGVISTFAGGASGLGDGGPATSGQLEVFGIAVDASRNILLSDQLNNRIRFVLP